MNPSVNRSSESPRPSGNKLPDKSSLSTQSNQSVAEVTSPASETQTNQDVQRQEPIPPPSHPRQYRAIGLIYGQYHPSQEQMTRGALITSDETAIDAVLLGRVLSLVKKHLDLEKPHLWVVYPRTRQTNDHLHIQIVGVWEPETLDRDESSSTNPTPSLNVPSQATPKIQDGYFSVRGEVIFYSHEKETVIIKIRQSPKRESERPKFFKLKLKGTLPDKPLGHFWDLHVQLQSDTLTIQEGRDLGLLPRKKPFPRKGRKPYPLKGRKPSFPSDNRPIPREKPSLDRQPTQRRPIPKPTKSNNPKNK